MSSDTLLLKLYFFSYFCVNCNFSYLLTGDSVFPPNQLKDHSLVVQCTWKFCLLAGRRISDFV